MAKSNTSNASRAARYIDLQKRKNRGKAEIKELKNLGRRLLAEGVNPKNPSLMQMAIVADSISVAKSYIKACNAAANRADWTVQPHVKKALTDAGITTDYNWLTRMVATIERTRSNARDTRSHRHAHGRKKPASIRGRHAERDAAVAVPAPPDPYSLTFEQRYPEAHEPITYTDWLLSEYPDHKDEILANSTSVTTS